MIASDGDALAAPGVHFRRYRLDRARRHIVADRAPGHVDGRAGFTEAAGYASPDATAGAGYQGYLALQGHSGTPAGPVTADVLPLRSEARSPSAGSRAPAHRARENSRPAQLASGDSNLTAGEEP